MFPSKDPGKGRNRKTSWTVEHLRGGGSFLAWIAGPTVWVELHWEGRSVPCRYELTDGQMHCPCQDKPIRRDLRGYTPLYAESGKPLVVVIPDYSFDVVGKILVHHPVLVSRGKGTKDPIVIREKRWADPWSSKTKSGNKGVEINDWLLTLWRDEELAHFVRSNPAPVCQSVPERMKTVEERNEEWATLNRIGKNGICNVILNRDGEDTGLPGDVPTLAEALPSINGKHHKRKSPGESPPG